ncbi:nucleotidyltransferase [Massilia sp. CCM 8695]|uniref:Cyclic GMP-AMP synthase n=1 Tax=Massilia frigida TaxID=2609281 RepID=A0ABX0NJA9_9BURK|nr:nucleotidyltransferase [Massilia frigida]NHZ83961.1 nucleotidyltransferase [Massilia frigida]
MAMTKYAELVEAASRGRRDVLQKAFQDTRSHGMLTECARELDAVNNHITVPSDLVDEAAQAYTELGELLVEKLRWPSEAIKIMPQGSTSTRTLVAAPTVEKFDIDAVFHVDLHRIEAKNPMGFFEEIGAALAELRAEEKNRCWRVHYPNKRFFIDFTPSVPLANVPTEVRAGMRRVSQYAATAIAVVDRPTGQWKTSNPQGMVNWISTQADRRILLQVLLDNDVLAKRADIEAVPTQVVPLSDTLRVAIRLFKRHRDMAVRRDLVVGEFKPISVIVTTLLTQCYEGLADKGHYYHHPVELLADLAALLPHMVERRNGEFWIANPTVDGENFAERWNHDNNQRYDAFRRWCNLLERDFARILESVSPAQLRECVRETFGCTGAEASVAQVVRPGWLTAAAPTTVKPVPATRGLA